MSEGTVASRWNLDAIEDAHRRWKQDPSSVDASWRYFFEGFELGAVRPSGSGVDASRLQTGVVRLIYAYRDLGHFLAHLDPLSDPRAEPSAAGAVRIRPVRGRPRPRLRHQPVHRPAAGHAARAARRPAARPTAAPSASSTCTSRTRASAAGSRSAWSRAATGPTSTAPRKLRILKSLHYAELFERFLHTRYTGQKRFSLEGAETLIPVLEAIVEKAPDYGVREIVLGMAHRGRLNVLANILRKPYEEIFAQFEENYLPDSMDGDGDVKYHLGFSSDRVNSRGRQVHLSLTPNPSHLEAVDPVVEGRTRAKQTAVRRRGTQAGHAAADPRRRRLRRPGAGGRDAQPVAAGRLHDRRHHPRHRQQPDRLHHLARPTPARRPTAPTWPR